MACFLVDPSPYPLEPLQAAQFCNVFTGTIEEREIDPSLIQLSPQRSSPQARPPPCDIPIDPDLGPTAQTISDSEQVKDTITVKHNQQIPHGSSYETAVEIPINPPPSRANIEHPSHQALRINLSAYQWLDEAEDHAKSLQDEVKLAQAALKAPFKISDGKFLCPVCEKSYSTPFYYKRHLQQHTGEFHCEKCNKSFGRPFDVQQHKCEALRSDVWRLPATSDSELPNPSQSRYAQKPNLNRCNSMLTASTIKDKTPVRYTFAPGYGDSTSAPTSNFEASIGQSIDPSHYNTERKHHKRSTAESAHPLDQMSPTEEGQGSPSKDHAKATSPLHVFPFRDEQNKIRCSVCNIPFNSHQAFNSHSWVHTGKRPFTCPYCPRDFNKEPSQKKHTLQCPRRNVPHGHIEQICTPDGLPSDSMIPGSSSPVQKAMPLYVVENGNSTFGVQLPSENANIPADLDACSQANGSQKLFASSKDNKTVSLTCNQCLRSWTECDGGHPCNDRITHNRQYDYTDGNQCRQSVSHNMAGPEGMIPEDFEPDFGELRKRRRLDGNPHDRVKDTKHPDTSPKNDHNSGIASLDVGHKSTNSIDPTGRPLQLAPRQHVNELQDIENVIKTCKQRLLDYKQQRDIWHTVDTEDDAVSLGKAERAFNDADLSVIQHEEVANVVSAILHKHNRLHSDVVESFRKVHREAKRKLGEARAAYKYATDDLVDRRLALQDRKNQFAILEKSIETQVGKIESCEKDIRAVRYLKTISLREEIRKLLSVRLDEVPEDKIEGMIRLVREILCTAVQDEI